ncbi:MAG: LysM peptidoglycan-binding domain-containing protein [Alphaproteobacteria bacterium]|nr:LysM peptidoglycan-binding domain-containing protein [Alphaproteobacteria bacterium]
MEALGALTPPSIDAVEIDGGRNYFAGTGADGAVIRLYVDNIFVADAEVSNGRWLLETDDVLKNRSQRVRVDQLLSGTADVASRAEIDFIFEEPAGVPADTAVAEAPITVPLPDYAIDTDAPVLVPVEPVAEPVVVAEAEPAVAAEPAPATEPAAATKPAADATAADTAVAEASVVVPEPDFGIDTDEPIPDEAIVSEAPTVVAEAAPTASQPASEPVAPPPADNAGSSTLAGGTASAADASGTVAVASGGASVAVPEPDFSIDTGIPVTIVAEAEQPVSIAAEAAAEEPAPAVVEEPAPEETVVAEAEVPQLVAVPVGAPEFGRFATGKAIIRAGDNLWTIARRVYGTGVRYTQIYGANRDQIRDPDLIYPGQVFALPDGAGEADTASN